ncbi:MAG: tetratricopeptide repeat protein, partial [Kiritimatiellae bacterium]|nr:tetratricopeptide repeat protein [Kiritimatiellia bacterium]
MKTVRVKVAAGDGVEDARRAVEDVLELLNRHFRPRGVEFVGAGEGEGDWTIALYWKDFGGMDREEFETVYEGFKKEKKPLIHVFFKEPDEGIAEAMKAFKEAFEKRYGHFYCHFETVDAVRFQLAAQSLSMLPVGVGERDALSVADGVVRLGREPVAKMENLSFAKLNAKRNSLVRMIAGAKEVAEGLEAAAAAAPEDEDVAASLREARMELRRVQEQLKQYDGELCSRAVFFAKALSEEMDERVATARALFEQGKTLAANKVLDLDELVESSERNLETFEANRDACEKNIQAFLAKAEMVMLDDSLTMEERTDTACRAYEEALRVARAIRWNLGRQADVLFDHAHLLDRQKRFQPSCQRYAEALALYRMLAKLNPAMFEADVARTLNNLALLHKDVQKHREAEEEYKEALAIQRRLASGNPAVYEAAVANTLNNLATLHGDAHKSRKAEEEYKEALAIYLRLAAANAAEYDADVANTLNNLATLHGRIQKFREAEEEYQEALAIYRRLALANPVEHDAAVATTLNNLAVLRSKIQKFREAEEEYQEALAIRRRLALSNPAVHEADVASTLSNLATLHGDMHKSREAEEECQEALGIQRRLAAANPAVHEADVALTLNNLAGLHGDMHKSREAEEEYQEAMGIQRRLAASNLAVHEADVALTLNNLAGLHGD